ncbi:ubiquitin-like domain-containing protein [Shouchella sp. JSM 1781072]|uniref:G5 and 3D domain-containing protein n=1 Tax=Bacillaceae TaxID=186817 RepID=UPI0026ECC371|nr:G5 and 3D domain-containing protein [Alkalihalobacillus sp. LMS6]
MDQLSKHDDLTKNRLPLQTKTFIVVGLFIALILFFTGLYEWNKKSVTVHVNGEESVVTTHAESIEELLLSLDIDVTEHDLVVPHLETELSDDMSVLYKQANVVTLEINGEEKEVLTTVDTIYDFLKEQGYEYRTEDHLLPSGDAVIEDGLTITYKPSVELNFAYDGNEDTYWSASATVADFLKEANVELGEDDRVKPGLDEHLENGLSIKLTRIEKVTDVIEESTAYETVREDDDSLNTGVERVLEQGERGKQELHYLITYEDGEEVERELVETKMVEEPKERIVAVGTKEEEAKQFVSETKTANATVSQRDAKPETTTSSSNQPSQTSTSKNEEKSESKTIQMTATAYSAECDGCSGVTATGINLLNDRNMKVVAVDPSVIPLGSKVHVEGYGEAIAGDTGGAINGNKIDLHVPTRDQAMSYGRKTVNVTILD